MAAQAAATAGTPPTRAVPLRQLAPAWLAVAVLAAIAWAVTVLLARSMGNGPEQWALRCCRFSGYGS